MANEQEKEAAGRAAAKLVRDGDIVGLGTGSTAYFAVVALGERVKAGLKIIGIPTSVQTADQARAAGIPLTTLDEHPEINITIDGADELDHNLNLIKGGGGALTREKIIAACSKVFVCIVESTKLVATLGSFPMPVEVIPMARTLVAGRLTAIGGRPVLRTGYITDNGNQILDVHDLVIKDPIALESALNQIPGIVTVGLFAQRTADVLLIGGDAGVQQI
jgi:ribose 5-phosphate isomerase A